MMFRGEVRRLALVAFGLFGFALSVATARAQVPSSSTYLWSGSGTTAGLSGQATFDIVADAVSGFYDVRVTLQNTASSAVTVSNQVLAGLYFDISVAPTSFYMISATASAGTVSNTGQTTATSGSVGTNICAPGAGGTAAQPTCSSTVSGGWEAAVNANGALAHYAVGTTGQTGIFNGNATSGVGQANYGIVPTLGISTSANSGITGNFPYVLSYATIIVGTFNTNQLTFSNINAAYGTAPDSTIAARPLPEPGTLSVLTIGAAGLALLRRRRHGRDGKGASGPV